jgi:hypothetical protein
MKRLSLIFVAFPLLAAAGPAAAQSSTPASAAPSPAQPPERAAPASPRLILRLDEIDGPKMNFGRSADEKVPSKDLPTLGGDARPIDRTPSPGSVFPKESTSNVPTPY